MVLLWRDNQFVDAHVANYDELCGIGFYADSCVPVPRPFPQSTLVIAGRDDLPDFFLAGNLFIISTRLQRLLEQFHVDAEFLDLTTVVGNEPYQSGSFNLVNILDSVNCFDYEHSKYQQTETGVTSIERLALDDSKAAGHHLFRVGPVAWAKDRNPKAVRSVIDCASEELASAVLQAGMTGMVFVRPEHARVYPAQSVAWRPAR